MFIIRRRNKHYYPWRVEGGGRKESCEPGDRSKETGARGTEGASQGIYSYWGPVGPLGAESGNNATKRTHMRYPVLLPRSALVAPTREQGSKVQALAPTYLLMSR